MRQPVMPLQKISLIEHGVNVIVQIDAVYEEGANILFEITNRFPLQMLMKQPWAEFECRRPVKIHIAAQAWIRGELKLNKVIHNPRFCFRIIA
ncbi:hypothetical protein D3C75_778760 [compost metagenome]